MKTLILGKEFTALASAAGKVTEGIVSANPNPPLRLAPECAVAATISHICAEAYGKDPAFHRPSRGTLRLSVDSPVPPSRGAASGR